MHKPEELTINGQPAVEFIKEAYSLGKDLNGPGSYDRMDPTQAALRRVRDWIIMAEADALALGKYQERRQRMRAELDM